MQHRSRQDNMHIQSDRLDVRTHYLLINVKYEQHERRTFMNESTTFLYLPQPLDNLQFCQCLLHLKALY